MTKNNKHMEIIPSEYQKDIFDFAKYGYGNAVISAVAGSGKTTTVIKMLDYIKPGKKILFLAFNTSIVEELKSKISNSNVTIKTLHSLGYSLLKSNFRDKNLEIDENKYKTKLLQYLTEIESEYSQNLKFITNVLKLCDLGRFFLVKNLNDLIFISEKYNLVILGDEIEVSFYLINWGKQSFNDINVIDYTDMIYLPNVLTLKIFKYDFVIVDEAQDLSISQMSLFMKFLKQGSRFIAVGDEKQTIYGFSGSYSESFQKLKKIPNTIELPLSTCYRCPKNIVKYAQKIVPEIEYYNDSIDGYINFNAKIEDVKDGDMIICRNTLPLFKLYLKLSSQNIKCYLMGNDICSELIELINTAQSDDIENIIIDIDQYLKKIENINSESKDSQKYHDLEEKIECIKIIGNNLKTKNELILKIKDLFSENKKEGICLSTIHKSKGLEADNVYILNKFLTPSKYAKQSWELEQERNLDYVSFTRSRKILGFLNIN